ncbi:thiamine-phosphate kinase [Bacillus sp. NPDC077027]|uniref:thiamine-phosphate kinase n=1 Tax=Bacillus sp. NPDC077027 TaxID=3390548 RepID=UPI003D00F222
MDEFDLIRRISPTTSHHRSLTMGIGDDASVYQTHLDKEEIVCVDTMVEHIHFRFDYSTAYEIGYKALAVNISDIAAMGGKPKYYLVSIAVPPHCDEDIITSLYKGMRSLAGAYQMDLIGGDTVSTRSDLVITVTVIGDIPKGTACYRHTARPGDIVFVTGELGSSAAGLALLSGEVQSMNGIDDSFFLKRHKLPEPHLIAGQICSSFQRVALNDVSDGLASELNEIAESSNVSIEIDRFLLPVHPDLPRLSENWQHWTLFGGEDFVLTGTIAEQDWKAFKQECQMNQIELTQIGIVQHGDCAEVILLEGEQRSKLLKKGYNHFKK